MHIQDLLDIILPLPFSAVRTHPHIDVGNGNGPLPMPEISAELPGGNWYDVAYCHCDATRYYLTHAANHFMPVVTQLEATVRALQMGGSDRRVTLEAERVLSAALNVSMPEASAAGQSLTPAQAEANFQLLRDLTSRALIALESGAERSSDSLRQLLLDANSIATVANRLGVKPETAQPT